MEFNSLHPTHFLREKGWKPEPNPFLPKPPRPVHVYFDKHIFIYSNQLWYDIDSATNMMGRVRRESDPNIANTVPTSENTQERPLFYRWFDKYLKKAEGLLSAYIMKPQGVVRDNALKEWDEKEMWLRMPDYWDDARLDELVQAIHHYISTGALYEYFLLTLTSKDPLTVDKATQLEDDELEILEAANASKPCGMIHTLKPFG
mgnify:FL=1